jgi:carbon-monoxide dehydrogenase medium subunit
VIPVAFDYAAPESLDEAIRALADGGEDAKLLAGGHSLIPLMKLRLAAPSLLVDLRKVPGMRGVERHDSGFKVGAMTPHSEVARRDELGVASRAAGLIADQQVRNRGTIGGSLAHADPASDFPAVLLACDGEVVARGSGGERTIPAAELFEDYLTTSLAPDEVIIEVRLPAMEGFGFGYQKFNRRAEDWAMVGVCALVRRAGDGSCEDVRIGLTHMGSTPLRASAAEEALRGGALDADSIRRAAEQAAEGTEPPGDLNATPDYKRHLARVLTRRALEEAAKS